MLLLSSLLFFEALTRRGPRPRRREISPAGLSRNSSRVFPLPMQCCASQPSRIVHVRCWLCSGLRTSLHCGLGDWASVSSQASGFISQALPSYSLSRQGSLIWQSAVCTTGADGGVVVCLTVIGGLAHTLNAP
jgi:hypothetical protein